MFANLCIIFEQFKNKKIGRLTILAFNVMIKSTVGAHTVQPDVPPYWGLKPKVISFPAF